MLTEIQAHSLLFVTDTQPHYPVDYFQNQEGPCKRKDHRNQYGQCLDAQLCRIAIEQPICACGIDRL